MGKAEEQHFWDHAKAQVEQLRQDALAKDVPYEKVQAALKTYLSTRPKSQLVFQYLGLRERSSSVTDLNQFISSMRKHAAFKNVSRADVRETFIFLAQSGVGTLIEGDKVRPKFLWVYWFHPHFSKSEPSNYLGIEMMPLLRHLRTRPAADRESQTTIHLTDAVVTSKPRLDSFTSEELRDELRSRGWIIKTEFKEPQ